MRVRRSASGFTLVELMIVVAIVGVVAALAARMYSRGVRGEGGPKFARTVMATLLDARHEAMTLGRPTRVTFDGTAKTIVTEAYDTTSTKWATQSSFSLPSTMRLCTSDPSVNIGGSVSPTCPLSGANVMCFWPNGRASMLMSSTPTCSTTSPASGSGGTVYLETNEGDKKYRIWVWGLTGMVKMIDQW